MIEQDQKERYVTRGSIALIAVYWAVQALRSNRFPSDIWHVVGSTGLKAALASVVAFSVLRASGETPEALGLRRKPLLRPVLIGLALGPVFFVAFSILVGPILHGMLGGPPTPPAVVAMLADPHNLPWWYLMSAMAGYAEELIRIFVLTRFERSFGRRGLALALVLDSIVFGLGHRYQGTSGVIANVIFGVVIGLLFLRRRSAAEVMVAHGFNDAIAISIGFATAGHL